MTEHDKPTVIIPEPALTHHRIAVKAYEIWESEGSLIPGDAVADWYAAEKALEESCGPCHECGCGWPWHLTTCSHSAHGEKLTK